MDLQIRRAEPTDAEGYARLFSDESALSGTLQIPYPTRERWREKLAQQDDTNVNLVACVEGDLVGTAGLHSVGRSPRKRHAATIGMAVRSDWQGKGVGKALLGALLELADHWYGLVRVDLQVYIDNERAIALYRKFGFEIEGTHRAFALRRGALVDAYTMARIRPFPRVGEAPRGA